MEKWETVLCKIFNCLHALPKKQTAFRENPPPIDPVKGLTYYLGFKREIFGSRMQSSFLMGELKKKPPERPPPPKKTNL